MATTATRHYRTVAEDTLVKAIIKPWSFLIVCVAALFFTAVKALVAMQRAMGTQAEGAYSRPSLSGVKQIAKASWPIAFNETGVYAFRRIDILILATVAGPKATGVYCLAQQLGIVAEKVRYLFEPMLAPINAQSRSLDIIGEHLRRLGRFIFSVQLAIITVFAFFGELILS